MSWRVGEPPYANCAECGQGRPVRVLNADGVCPWCTLAGILTAPNPYLPLEDG